MLTQVLPLLIPDVCLFQYGTSSMQEVFPRMGFGARSFGVLQNSGALYRT